MKFPRRRVFVFTAFLFLITCYGATAAAATPGLVAAYGFNEGSGATVRDSSGKNNNGTGTNGTWMTAGRFGGALSFNGSSTRVTIPDTASLDLTNGLTLEAWVRPSSLSGWNTIIMKEKSAGLVYGLYANSDTGRPAGDIFTQTERDTRGTTSLPLNTWTHLTTTYDGTILRLYINGTQVSSRTISGNILTSTGAIRIGSNAVWGEYFRGLIDEVRVYNRALTATEIQTDMNTPVSGSTTTPVVGVSISPTSASLQTGGTRQFTATVSGTTNTAVTWSATGGSISNSGLYTAPSSTGTYTVRATSVADTTKFASATVTVSSPPAVGVSISPTSASLPTRGTRQFTATVSGTTNTAVTWSATGGSISSSGLYTAPSSTGTYTVRATSVADTTKYASATVTVSSSTTYQLSISPTSLSFGSVAVGNGASKTVTLSNTGTGSVQVTAANFTGGVFRASGLSLPFTIATGAQKTVTIVFQPDISGPFSGSVSFVSNATNSPAVATLSGSGTAAAPHSVDLAWSPSTSVVSGYFVYRGTASSGPFSKLNSGSVPSTNYTDSTVQNGRTYYYVVTAVDSSGRESAYSNAASAVIPTL